MTDTKWARTWAGKNRQYLDLVDRVEEALAKSSTVVIHSVHEPAQSQWENAYVDQIGQALPIQPGCRLLWYDIKNGRMTLYTTTYDINNNTATSGTVFPAIKSHAGRDTMLVTGGFRQNGYLSNSIIKGHTLHANFMMDRTSFGRQGITYFRAFAGMRGRKGLADTSLTGVSVYFNLDSSNPYNTPPIGYNLDKDIRGWNVTLVSTNDGVAPVPAYNSQEEVPISTPIEVMASMPESMFSISMQFTMAIAYDERQGSKWMGVTGKVFVEGLNSHKSLAFFGIARRNGYSFGEMLRIDPQNSEGSLDMYGRGAILMVGQNGGIAAKEFADG